MVRARFVFLEQGGERLMAVYPKGVKPSELGDVVRRLIALPGVRARATRAALRSPDAPLATLIWMGVMPMFNPHRARQLFKELTQPELSVAIGRVNVIWRRCPACKRITSSCEANYIPDFEPKNKELFARHMQAEIGRLNVATMWPTSIDAPPTQMMDAVEDLLAKQGAYASEVFVDAKLMPRRCRRCT